MRYCTKCGHEIAEDAAFCGGCGASVVPEAIALTPVETPARNEALEREEQEFLQNTHQLLCWERKAWSIASKAFTITGIVFAALFGLVTFIGMIAALDGEVYGAGIMMVMGITYAVFCGGMFIALGIVSKKACEKMSQYIDTVYTDFSLTYNRSGNIGMLIFNALLGVMSPVFFIINFARIKACGATIERILKKQGVQR